MPQYTQNVVFDNSPRDPYWADDDVIGYEVRKKSIASNLWECLTGKKQKPEIYLFEEPPRQTLTLYGDRPPSDLFHYEEEYYGDDLAPMPWRSHRRWSSPRNSRSYHYEEAIECSGCACCFQYPDLGICHRPFPRPRGGSWHYDYDYHEHGHRHGLGTSWDPAPFWDPEWIPRRWRSRLSRRSRSDRRRSEHPGQTLQRELVKLMHQRLREMRHERIYHEWPRGCSLDDRRRRNDRIDEIDEQLVDLERMRNEAYSGSGDGSDYDFSDSDDL